MGDSELIVAIVALLISIIVGIATMSQLLAQIFSTAEGLHKCSTSLLDLWSKHPTTRTRRKWRWSEARFETKFVTPEICLGNSASAIPNETDDLPHKIRSQTWIPSLSIHGRKTRTKRKTESILGADFELDYVLFISAFADDAPDMVSWLSFLTFLRIEIDDAKTEIFSEEANNASNLRTTTLEAAQRPNIVPLELSWPRIRYHLHSWDFMPPNAPRPFAKSTIHEIAVLVRRTGMVWKTFDPKHGNMSAEGGAHVLTGTLEQGLGLVLEYRCLDDKRLARDGSNDVIRRRLKNALTQSQMTALDKASASTLGLDQPHARAKDEESQRSEETKVDQRDERDRKARRVGLWVKEMDKIIFGFIPVDSRLGLPDIPFAEISDCFHYLVMLSEEDPDICHELQKATTQNPRWAFNDLIYMTPPVLRLRHGDFAALSFKSWAEYRSIFWMDFS